MEELYLKLRLWYWWCIYIKRDEFSYKLNYYHIRSGLLKKYPRISKWDIDGIISRQRNLAHVLEQTNLSLGEISPEVIKMARI